MEQRIILSDRFESDLALCISECEHDGIFVICDTSSHRFCWSEMAHFPTLRQAEVDHDRRWRRQQEPAPAHARLGATAEGRSQPPLARHQSRRRHGDGPRRLRGSDLQAGPQFHQRPHHAAGHGRCERGRQDGHQLRGHEERDRHLQGCFPRHHQYRLARRRSTRTTFAAAMPRC